METDADLEETFDLMDRMCEINPKMQHFGIFLYTPFPSPILNELPAEFKPPTSLPEWGKIDVFQFKPPWHSKKQVEKLRTISAVARYKFYPKGRINERSLSFKISLRSCESVGRLSVEAPILCIASRHETSQLVS